MEVTIKIGFDCIESPTRHVLNNLVSVDLTQRGSPDFLTDEEYAMLDHAFRKTDEALDAIKNQIRIASKVHQKSLIQKVKSVLG